MFWSPSSRHARPRGRAAVTAAYSELLHEISGERHARFAAELEVHRLAGMANELSARLTLVTRELADVRHELAVARTTASTPDPRIGELALEAADLRAVVVEQQAALTRLTERLIEALERTAAPQAPAAETAETVEAQENAAPPVSPPAAPPAPPVPGAPVPGTPSPYAVPPTVAAPSAHGRPRPAA